jgi:hypothetical protein
MFGELGEGSTLLLVKTLRIPKSELVVNSGGIRSILKREVGSWLSVH